MNYYKVDDVIKLTGLSQSASYELIHELNKKLQREYPGTFILKGKIPKWYFDKKTMMINGGEKNETIEN